MKKIGNSFAGVMIGIIMLIGGSILLWWNEGNNVRNIKTTDELAKELIDVSCEEVNKDNEGKLISTNGKITLSGEVSDYLFGIKVNTAHLKRVVEMYQWIEEEHTDSDGNTTYDYKKEWKDELIDSSNYKEYAHKNPSSMSYKSDDFTASYVRVGAFSLTKDQVLGLATDKEWTLTNEKTLSNMSISGNYMTTTKDINNPQVGDVRIKWLYNDWEEASILAKQKGNSFEDYVSKSDKNVNRVEKGILSGNEIVQKMIAENKMLKWLLRGAGLIIIFIGYLLILGPITTIASFVPILGNLVGGLLAIVSFLVGLVQSLIIIAIAWIRFRPVIGFSLLGGALLLFIIARIMAKKSSIQKQ